VLLVVGRIGRVHGVRGEVLVDVRTDDPGARFAPGSSLAVDMSSLPAAARPLLTEDRLTVDSARPHSGRLIVRFAGVANRDQAEGLRGTVLVIDSADLPEIADVDEFHDHELIGLRAEGTGGELLGEVVDVAHFAQDLLVLRRPDGSESLVPFVAAIVPTVEVASGRVVIDPPPGLLGPVAPASPGSVGSPGSPGSPP
jgi:16S rRNA processing protein RimM